MSDGQTNSRKIKEQSESARLSDIAINKEAIANAERGIEPEECLIQDGAEFSRKEIKKAPVLIDGLLKQGSKMVLGGSSKSFKTWTLLNLGLSVAYGKSFWSHAVQQGKVLYVDLELDEEDLQFRKNKIERAMEIEEPIPGQFDVLPLRRKLSQWRKLSKNSGAPVDPFQKIVDQVNASGKEYSLIILDPLYKFLGKRNENDAGDMGDLFADIECLADDTGAAVALGVHFSKGNQAMKEAMDRISGSGVFARDPDSVLVMTKLEQDGCFAVEASLRKFKPLESFSVRWEEPLMVRDNSLDPSNLKGKAGRKSDYDPEQVLEHLPTNGTGITRTEWETRVLENEGMSKGSFNKFVKVLQSGEKAFKSEVDKLWYRLGQQGQ